MLTVSPSAAHDRIELILVPAQWIVGDVLPDAVQIDLVTDDMLPIIALPERQAGRAAQFIDAFGRLIFVIRHNLSQRWP